MVQRKATTTSKLGIQAGGGGGGGHVKSNNQLVNRGQPSPPQNHPPDGKNRGHATAAADLKKKNMKMKRSRPMIKRSDFETFRSSPSSSAAAANSRRGKPQQPPQKQATSPNYMKSTSSFDARKEQARTPPPLPPPSVSPDRVSPVSLDKSKYYHHKHKVSRSGFTRTSSLKKHMVRTLTKNPSFKPSRPSKICSHTVSGAGVCEEDLDVQRATCSSTLKHSKFPNYLSLNPGGTSVMKVYPYTYCSLNGHHHAPSSLPPLRLFLSLRRRMLKAQQKILKPPGGENTEPQVVIDLKGSPVGSDFFIKTDEAFLERFSDESPGPGVDVTIDSFGLSNDVVSVEMDSVEVLSDGQKEEVGNGVCPSSVQEEMINTASVLLDEPDLEASDMKWDAVSIEMDSVELFSDCQMQGVGDGIYSPSSAQEEMTKTTSILLDERDLEASDIKWDAREIYSASCVDDCELVLESQHINKDDFTTIGLYDEESVSDEAWMEYGDSQVDSDSYRNCVDLDLGDHEIKCANNHHEDESRKEAYACGLLGNEESESFYDLTAPNQDEEADKDYTACQNNLQGFECDALKENPQIIEVFDCSSEPKTEYSVQVDAANSEVVIEPSAGNSENKQDATNEDNGESMLTAIFNANEKDQIFVDKCISNKTQDESYKDESKSISVAHNKDSLEKDRDESRTSNISNSLNFEDLEDSGILGSLQVTEKCEQQGCSKMELESGSKSNVCSSTLKITSITETANIHLQRGTGRNKLIEELEDLRDFNPRGPNYLPVEPDPEGERVDLKHQIVDERKSAEEWMVDFALRQAVTRLAPARKRKVALLVEAFERVMPIPSYQSHLIHNSEAFSPTRQMQACS